VGPRHRLRKPRALQQATGVLYPGQIAESRRGRPPSYVARDTRKNIWTIPRFKSKDELLEEEFAKFVADYKPDEAESIPAIKTYFKAYITSDQVRHIIESRQFTALATNPVFSTRDFKAVPQKYRILVPEYVKDYVSLNQFVA
jgi:hypothetical protein